MKQKVETFKAPAAVGPYSQAIRTDGLVFLSGQLPIDPLTGTMSNSAKEQAKQSLRNLQSILKELGLDMDSIVKTTVLLSNMEDFQEVNQIYEQYFSEPFPARVCFSTAELPKGAKVEIDAVAVM